MKLLRKVSLRKIRQKHWNWMKHLWVHTLCQVCLSEEVQEIELDTEGTLYSFTVTRVPAGRFSPPHALGPITLRDGVRLTAPLIMGDQDFEIGARMKMVLETLWTEDDCGIVGYKFRQIK